jgi:hypothetical protein
MAQTYSVAGAVSAAFVDGGSPSPISLAATIPYVNRADFQRNYTAPVVDDVVHMDTLVAAGAKGVTVVCLAGTCTVKFNGGLDAWPLSPGGHFSWCNPSTPFPTAALINTPGPATVVFLAVG